MTSANNYESKEISLTCTDGIQLAGKRWTTTRTSDSKVSNNKIRTLRFLCLHGWLDNCASFDQLATKLLQKLCDDDSSHHNIDIVAIDLPGHGRSAHKSLDGPSLILPDFVYYMYDTIQQLGWDNNNDDDVDDINSTTDLIAIGHSMGASVALMFAAAFPPLNKLILLDSLGPLTKPEEEVTKGIEKHVKARSRGKPPGSVYPDLPTAIETRCLTAKTFPGNQYISVETATALVERASVIRPSDGKLEFLHDQRLHWPSMLSLTDRQLDQIYKDVASHQPRTKTCVVTAKDGMPFPPKSLHRIQVLVKPDVMTTLPGSHHFHSDPDTVDCVAKTIVNFILQQEDSVLKLQSEV